ncbi:hypothetical protein BX600DRAFT_447663 [Xylariales sp. PMI_506]|nr:hypothetical protein BX600DRAFT_447663 [Xylariales sp. PMI_506]
MATINKRGRDEEEYHGYLGLPSPCEMDCDDVEASTDTWMVQDVPLETAASKRLKFELHTPKSTHASLSHPGDASLDGSSNLFPPTPGSCADIVGQLDPDTLRAIVCTLAADSLHVQDVIKKAYEQQRVSQTMPPPPSPPETEPEAHVFPAYQAQVSQILSSGGSERWATERGSAHRDVRACVDAIGDRAALLAPCTGVSKGAALEALHDIAVSVIRAGDDEGRYRRVGGGSGRGQAAREVRAEFERGDDCVPRQMLRIVESMAPAERLAAASSYTAYGSTLLRSIEWVHERAVESYLAGFYDLSQVLGALTRQ